jgi:hypothetical protein
MTTEQRLKQAFERPAGGLGEEDGAYDRFQRHRRRRTRRAAAGTGVALCLVAGLALAAPRLLPARGGVAGGGKDHKGPPLFQLGTVHLEGARLEGDGRRLVVSFTGGAPPSAPPGPCSPLYQGEAEVTDDAVTVTVSKWTTSQSRTAICGMVGYARSLTVTLPEPLRGRRLVDGATGRTMPLVDTALRQPSYLPAGYRYLREEVDNEVSRRTWTRQGRSQELLDITQGSATVARLGYRPVVLQRPTVHGAAATVWKSRGFDDSVCLFWAEGAIGFRICSLGSPTAPLPPAELVKIGEGLR